MRLEMKNMKPKMFLSDFVRCGIGGTCSLSISPYDKSDT